MKAFFQYVFLILLHLGGIGLLILGILDSSFLFMPLGNDLLVTALTARRHTLMPVYALTASLGSTLGCLLIDGIFRKGGEKALETHLSKKRLEYVRRRMKRSAAWALAIACLMPPPFPFTPFVMAASALQYPRRNLVALIAGFRMIRFTVIGLLAITFGPGILRIAKSQVVINSIIALIVISGLGSAFSVYGWIRRSRKVEAQSV